MPEHPRNHPHHHSARVRAEHTGGTGEPTEPYPYIYSKDPMDPRRFLQPGETYGPATARGPSTWVIWVLGIVLALIIGAGLISAIIQAMAR